MKMKHINKLLASALSISMLMGGAMPVQAADGEVDAPIYSFDVVDVIVPTTYAVAFNPQGLTVKTGDSTSSTSQILSKNYGIINKSTSDKVITVSLTVADQNPNSEIEFVDTAEEVTSAEDGEFKIHLTAIPANTAEVQVGGASADKATDGAALSDVTMTGDTSNAVTLKAGDNIFGFKLLQAKWDLKDGSNVTLGETTSNNVADSYEVKNLADEGKGITAFTFGGEMNKNANWSELQKGIKISVVYDNLTAASDLAAIDGTGALVKLDIAPTFTTGSGIGQIKYSRGAGDNGVKAIKKIEATNNGKVYDGYNANSLWPAATDEAGVVTLPSQYMGYFKTGDTIEATVTYETNAGTEEKAKVDVYRVEPDVAPTFTTGSGIGQINYTPGSGDNGLKAIKKIEATNAGKVYDGYNASTSPAWPAATDVSGVITLPSEFMGYFKTDTIEATVTYETNAGAEYTASVTVKVK